MTDTKPPSAEEPIFGPGYHVNTADDAYAIDRGNELARKIKPLSAEALLNDWLWLHDVHMSDDALRNLTRDIIAFAERRAATARATKPLPTNIPLSLGCVQDGVCRAESCICATVRITAEARRAAIAECAAIASDDWLRTRMRWWDVESVTRIHDAILALAD